MPEISYMYRIHSNRNFDRLRWYVSKEATVQRRCGTKTQQRKKSWEMVRSRYVLIVRASVH